MKKHFLRISCILSLLMVGTIFCFPKTTFAEGEEVEEALKAATSISISPVNKIMKLEPNSVYEDSFNVTNGSNNKMDFEVYASPYSYVFSEDENEYRLGFSNETAYTQIVRWITFKDKYGNYTSNPKYTAGPGETIEVSYKVSTPSSIPNGGQYAVLFAHTLSATTTSNGIRTEASPGLVLYGRSMGETISSAEISNLSIEKTMRNGEENKNIINASAKVKNTGNVDFMAYGKLKVSGLFGGLYYETPSDQGMISIIPETELTVSDKWEETPYFGLFRVTWSVEAAGENETITQMILILPAPIIVFMILLLTIIIIWIIIMVRKRKERRSRFMV